MTTRECDVCGFPATTHRPATKSTKKSQGREDDYYCDRDAKIGLGFGDGFHKLGGCRDCATREV